MNDVLCPSYVVCGELGFQKFMFNNIIQSSIKAYNEIRNDFNDIRSQYIALGYKLDQFKTNGYYKTFGFDSFEAFVEANFHIEKTALSRCLNVFYEFSARKGSAHQPVIDAAFEDYNYSQLSELVSMAPADRKLVSADMSVSKIRDLKKSLKKNVNQVLDGVLPDSYSVSGPAPAVPDSFAPSANVCPEAQEPDEPDEVDDYDPDYSPEPVPSLSANRFNCFKFSNLKGIAKINYLVKTEAEHPAVGFAFYSSTGSILNPVVFSQKLIDGVSFDFLGFDSINNLMIYRESND